MKLIQNDPFLVLGQPSEKITVEISSTYTNHNVVYTLNEMSGSISADVPLVFTLTKEKTELDLMFHFSKQQGGAYEVQINGARGSDHSHYVLKQSGGIDSQGILKYVFISELGGDEGKDDY